MNNPKWQLAGDRQESRSGLLDKQDAWGAQALIGVYNSKLEVHPIFT